MKKLPLLAITMFLFASLAMAQTTFSPTIMEITCPAEINYDFGDEELTIPFSVSGVPGAFWLVINTYGKADEISQIRNGFLGWHYVDKIDTTVYVSGRYQRELGDQNIKWDGTNSDGEKVAEATYSYYLWGYDDKSPKQKVTDFVNMANQWDSPMNTFVTHDEQGIVLEKPFIFGNRYWHYVDDDTAWKRMGTAYKWELGSNPEDLNGLETTWMPFYVDRNFHTNYDYGGPVLMPGDYTKYAHASVNYPSHTSTMMLWTFVPGGDATYDPDWLGWDNDVEWESIQGSGHLSERPSVFTNMDNSEPYIYGIRSGAHILDRQWDGMVIATWDGDIVLLKMLNEFYFPDDNNTAGNINSCITSLATRGNNRWLVSTTLSCINEMIDTTDLLEDPYAGNYIRWQNTNGDYFNDRFYWEDSDNPWACIDDQAKAYQNTNSNLDGQVFTIFFRGAPPPIKTPHPDGDLTILTQDGTGVTNILNLGGNTQAHHNNSNLVDSGSQYDGVYCPPADPAIRMTNPIWFVTFDSAGGKIVPGAVQPGVEEAAQAAYALEQNAPNPFNPTTTIGFTLAKAGDVTIDVYNVAGQKVNTLMNDFMEAGSHSVVWDASGFSAGVYFYTIKSGDFSRTMKMTLLK